MDEAFLWNMFVYFDKMAACYFIDLKERKYSLEMFVFLFRWWEWEAAC